MKFIDQVSKVDAIRDTLIVNGMQDGVHVRLTLTRGVKLTSGMDPRLNQAGPTLIVLAEHKRPVYDKTGLSLITSSIRRSSPDVLDPKIHHNNLLGSILAKIEATYAGADDALMLDTAGFVAETNATFDQSLRERDPAWGVRDVNDVATAGAARGLDLVERVPTPHNNFSLVLRRSVSSRAP